MSDITLNTQSITGNHNFVPPGADWNLGSGSKKWNGGYFGTIIADAGIPAGTAATGGDKIGQIRFSINPNIEPGYLALNGQEVNREDYPNLWAWVQQQVGFLVEESEWQSISGAHNGNVGKYSVGNGSTTFRLPNLGCWVRGGGEAGTASGVGGNLDAGLPNITGSTMHVPGFSSTVGGAFTFISKSAASAGTGPGWEEPGYTEFSAAKSNAIYGNSETVQPDSIIGIWLVKAYHVPVDNMGNTITVNGAPPDENGNIAVDALTNAIPVGTILPFAGNTVPEGFLACNGAAVSRTTYAALYSAIGTTYGSGDGSTTFNLPNVPSSKAFNNGLLTFSGTGYVRSSAAVGSRTTPVKVRGAGSDNTAYSLNYTGSTTLYIGSQYNPGGGVQLVVNLNEVNAAVNGGFTFYYFIKY